MGNAFSGPTSFRWLGFTDKATAVLQTTPFFFFTILITLGAVGTIIAMAGIIHYFTNKPYYKPKPKKGEVKR